MNRIYSESPGWSAYTNFKMSKMIFILSSSFKISNVFYHRYFTLVKIIILIGG